jgi:hypothetical protein
MTKYIFIAALLMSNFSYANSDASKCAKIISDKERLSCYDLVFKDTSDLITEKVEKESNPIEPIRKKALNNKPKTAKKPSEAEDNFGLSYQQIKKVKQIEDSGAIRSKITRVTKQVSRKVTFRLENGQVWKSEAALGANKVAQFKKGSSVELIKSRMGGYSMVNLKTNSRIKIKRIK